MNTLQVHANQVRTCKACFARIVWLENAWKKWTAFNIPEGERGKNWLSIDETDRHDCPKKEWLELLKRGRK